MTRSARHKRIEELASRARLGERGVVAPGMRQLLDGPLGGFAKIWFRPRLIGWEHFPKSGPFLMVANHSGCGFADVLCLSLLWHQHFEYARPATGMAHPAAFYIPMMAWMVRTLGAVPATYAAARAALQDELPVIVFPGGDHEAFRPVWQANRVDFANRKGFLKLAKSANVSIVPIGVRGAHYTIPLVWRSRLMAYLTIVPALLGGRVAPVALVNVLGGLVLLLGLAGSLALLGACGRLGARGFADQTRGAIRR